MHFLISSLLDKIKFVLIRGNKSISSMPPRRQAPETSAAACRVGSVKTGADGNLWAVARISPVNARGHKKWVRCRSPHASPVQLLKGGGRRSARSRSSASGKKKRMPPRNRRNFRPTNQGAGMTKAGVEAYRRMHPGSKLKTAVTAKKVSPADAKRRKLYCARSKGQMEMYPKAAADPNSRLRQARKRWRCK